jgi:hypothetical protein
VAQQGNKLTWLLCVKVQENQKELELAGVRQLLVYTDYVNLLGAKMNITKNTETQLYVGKKDGL